MKLYEKKLYHILRIVLAVVFIYASIDKIMHPHDFSRAVFNYQILPDYLINITAILLPWLELVLGICLLANIWMSGASLTALVLMILFMAAISFNLIRGLDVGCGCFSSTTEEGMTALTLLRDILFLVMSLGLVTTVIRQNRRILIKQGGQK
jgi:uncharacterized membrane protein YphA (DoxX/SURF4 family)